MARHRIKFMPTSATFHLGEVIGRGTVGTVYRATSPDLAEQSAVKLLHPSLAEDKNLVRRFEREISIMERLNHPHIVQHFGGGYLQGQLFYAMQLLEQGTLKDTLRAYGQLPWPQVAAYGVQICSALQHAHNHGIIHRDLKPSNLFFAKPGHLVLGDFGIARDSEDTDVTDHGITVGTFSYMSPEQIRGAATLSGKADLYSLGCVLYEMLSGAPPFEGDNATQVWEQHLYSQPASLRDHGVDCPAWLDQIVLQLLEKDPEKRPFSARSVEGQLRQQLQDEFGDQWASQAQQLPALPIATREYDPRRLLLVIAVTAGLLAAAIWWGSK